MNAVQGTTMNNYTTTETWLKEAMSLAETEDDFVTVFTKLDYFLDNLELTEAEILQLCEIAGYA